MTRNMGEPNKPNNINSVVKMWGVVIYNIEMGKNRYYTLEQPVTTCIGNCRSPVAGDVFDDVYCCPFFPTRCLG